MNSSTSGFRNFGKTLVLVVAMIAAGEVALRLSVGLLSGNHRHIREIPRIAGELSEKSGLRMLFLGNSMVYNGIDTSVIGKELGLLHAGTAAFGKVNPDGTDLWDWYFLYKKVFAVQPRPPDIVVVGFGRDLVDDQRRPNPSRLAANFTGVGDIPELVRLGFNVHRDLPEYLLACGFGLYAHREAIRSRLMDGVVPFYREITTKLRVSGGGMGVSSKRRDPVDPTYERLQHFYDLVRSGGGRTVLVALPTRDGYGVSDQLPLITERDGDKFLDLRSLPGLKRKEFTDAIHVNAQGAGLISTHLAMLLPQAAGLIGK